LTKKELESDARPVLSVAVHKENLIINSMKTNT